MKYFWLKHCYLPNSRGLNCCQSFSTSTKPVSKQKTRISEVKQFFKTKECLTRVQDFIPDRFFRVKGLATDYNFVVDDEIAENVANVLKNYLAGPTPVIEANPGLGLLTRHLLRNGVEKLFVYDSMINQMAPLRDLMTENPDKLFCVPIDVFQVGRIVARDKIDQGDRFETMFKDIQPKTWNKEPACKLFGVLLAPNYITYLLRSIAFHDVFAKMGRFEHFLIVSEKILRSQVMEKPLGRIRTSMLFNCFFEIEQLGRFPRLAFLPWDKTTTDSRTDHHVHLIRALPKANLYNEFTKNELKIFWYFVNTICRTKTTSVIAFFENWAPSSGLRLIKLGLSPLTEIRDITATEMVQLFRLFISLPQFDEDHFIHMQEAELLTTTEPAKPVIVKEQ